MQTANAPYIRLCNTTTMTHSVDKVVTYHTDRVRIHGRTILYRPMVICYNLEITPYILLLTEKSALPTESNKLWRHVAAANGKKIKKL